MKILGKECSAKEVAEITLKSVASSFPIASSLASVYGDWQNKVQFENVLDVLTRHEQQLSELQETINKTYIESDRYAYDTIQTILKGQNEIDESKRTLYAQYLTSCCLSKNIDAEYNGTMLDIIVRMNNSDLVILRSIDQDEPHGKSSSSISCITNYVNHYDGCKYADYEIETRIDFLVSLSLVRRIDIKGIGKALSSIGFEKDISYFVGTEDVFYRSNLGNRLINFMSKLSK